MQRYANRSQELDAIAAEQGEFVAAIPLSSYLPGPLVLAFIHSHNQLLRDALKAVRLEFVQYASGHRSDQGAAVRAAAFRVQSEGSDGSAVAHAVLNPPHNERMASGAASAGCKHDIVRTLGVLCAQVERLSSLGRKRADQNRADG